MKYKNQTAFITGGASGIARALTQRLVDGGARVFIADINLPGATAFTADLNALHPNSAFCDHCDVNSWSDLTSCLLRALELFDGRIDYIFPIAGLTERQVIPKPSEQRDVRREGFVKPDLTVLETNATGMVNLVLAAVQVFRGQEPREELGAMRGKIVCVASTCGLYALTGVPVYTASKHAMVGLTRTYGVRVLEEKMTFNAICPHVVQTGISKHTPWFYEELQRKGYMTDINRVVDGFEEFLGESQRSAECLEVGPTGKRVVEFVDWLDEETRLSCEMVEERSGRLWKG